MFEHFVAVLVSFSSMVKHYRLNSTQNSKKDFIGEILILNDFLFSPLVLPDHTMVFRRIGKKAHTIIIFILN